METWKQQRLLVDTVLARRRAGRGERPGPFLERLTATALDRLPEDYRQVFLLTDVAGLSAVGAAQLLGVTAARARGRLQRARLLLDDALAPSLPEVLPNATRAG